MSPESNDRYFQNFESEALPQITWQEMIENRVVIAPNRVLTALGEAEHLLTTSPGSNLERRKVLAPEWFSYWSNLLVKVHQKTDVEFIASGNKLVDFDDLSVFLSAHYADVKTGEIFVAGAEGHKGHVHAAYYMANIVPITIWGFEQERYMERKSRGASFLPLELRLSMWFYEHSITHLTVLPLNTSGVPDNDHYGELFVRSGANYFFVHESDPYLLEKLKRGDQDLSHVIYQDFPQVSTTDAVKELHNENDWDRANRIAARLFDPRVIPNLPVGSTSSRVQKLMADEKNDTEILRSPSSSMLDAYLTGAAISRNIISFEGTIFEA